ncbi:hypothetical protein G6F31_017681 [Rhizopus arrhizus]|nr:hypothetical protein G6F31_017681 [Rhizopus arrhizus]
MQREHALLRVEQYIHRGRRVQHDAGMVSQRQLAPRAHRRPILSHPATPRLVSVCEPGRAPGAGQHDQLAQRAPARRRSRLAQYGQDSLGQRVKAPRQRFGALPGPFVLGIGLAPRLPLHTIGLGGGARRQPQEPVHRAIQRAGIDAPCFIRAHVASSRQWRNARAMYSRTDPTDTRRTLAI